MEQNFRKLSDVNELRHCNAYNIISVHKKKSRCTQLKKKRRKKLTASIRKSYASNELSRAFVPPGDKSKTSKLENKRRGAFSTV